MSNWDKESYERFQFEKRKAIKEGHDSVMRDFYMFMLKLAVGVVAALAIVWGFL